MRSSNGRFSFGIGVSHAAAMSPMGITQGKPLSDIRQFVEDLHAVPKVGELPPLVLATLRHKMIALAEAMRTARICSITPSLKRSSAR